MATPCTCGAGGGSGGGAKSKNPLKRRTAKKGERQNPYADRGVEKFSALLAEIEEKKRIIYSQINPEEVSLIRFVHAGDNKLKPVVVRANNNNKNKLASKQKEFEPDNMMKTEAEKKPLEDAGDQEEEEQQQKQMEIIEMDADDQEKKKQKSLLMEVKLQELKVQPWMRYRVVGTVIFVLLLLLVAVSGKYWKNYYLLQLQATVCPRIQDE